jgi:uncharacterized protein
MTVVLDTNVILSAILFGGKPRQVLQAALSGAIRVGVSESTFAELLEVLNRPKFGFSARFVQIIASEFAAMAEWVEPTEHFEMVKDDPKDNQFIDCAIVAGAAYLVSGDKHLLKLGKCGKTAIVNVDSFIDILSKLKPEGYA